MPDVSDMELLREYERQGSEEAFAALVRHHINLVYSTAYRHVGIAAHAEEITQVVFIILARKATGLRPATILDAWLYETTRLTSLSFLRGERRRQLREQEAYMQSTSQEPTDASIWNQLAPLLDIAMARLGKEDREAVVLRYFKDKSLREVAAALNVTETAAQSRVRRAVEKLRRSLTKRGVVLPAAVLTAAISANSVQAAPALLAKSVTAAAIAKGAAASGSTLILIKGALKIMAWTKSKTTIVVSVAVVLAAGTGLQTLAMIKKHLLQQQVANQIVVPGRFWTNAGYADPKSAITTFLWAASQSDGQAILDSFTPDGQQHWQRDFGKQMQSEGKSLTQILAQEVPRHFSSVMNAGFSIVDQKAISADEVLLHLDVPGDAKVRAFWFRKIGGEWKIYQFE